VNWSETRKQNPSRVTAAPLRTKRQILKVSKRVRIRADLGSDFPFGPALRPNSHGVALFKLGQKKWALHFLCVYIFDLVSTFFSIVSFLIIFLMR